MSKLLVLCVGLNKTGTTSIQQTCFANRSALRQAGFLYPTYSLDGEANATNHSPLLQMMFWRESGQPGPFGRFREGHGLISLKHRDRVRARLAGLLEAQASRALMVAEGVSEMDVDELRDLRTWFEGRGWDVRVVCSIRHPASWTHSMVGQRVAGLRRMTIAGVVDMFVQLGGLVRPRIDNIREVFPDAEFRSFEVAAAHPRGLVAHFLDSIGVPLEDVDFRRAREGRSDCAIRMMSVLNEREGVKFGNDALAALRNITGPKFQLRPSEAAPLISMVDAENDWLGETFGETFHGPAMRFGPVDWTNEGRAQLAAALKQLPAAARAWLLQNKARWAGASNPSQQPAALH